MKTRNLLLGLLFGLFWQVGYGQIDTQFWFVAPEVSKNDYQRFDEPIVLRLTTLNEPASITISMPAEPAFIPLHMTMEADTSLSVDLSPWLELLENKPPNTILNKGILVEATASITAYYDVVSSYCNCNPELYSLKGKNALGTEFLMPGQTHFYNSLWYNPIPYNAFDIVATENNTTVTIIPAKEIVGHAEGQSFQIVLNKGQTWSGVATGQSINSHLHGTSIISDKLIAVTLSDDLLWGITCGADLVGDQIVPINMAGNEYIGVRGFLTNGGDRLFVLGLSDNTNLYFDGSTSPISINRGEVYNHLIQNNSTHLSSSSPVLVYQTSGYDCELGSAVLPQIQCTGSESVSVFRSYDSQFGLLLFTEVGNETGFLVNGDSTIVVASDFSEVPGTNGHWLAARVLLTPGQVPIGTTCKVENRNGVFHLGLISDSGGGCSYGYFSNFNSLELGSDLTVCAGDTAILDAGFGMEPYLWSTGDTSRTISVTTPGTYWVQAGNGSCLLSDTIYVGFQSLPVVNLGSDTLLPCGVLSGTLSTTPGYATYQWNVPGDSNLLEVTTSGTYWCRVSDSIGCTASDTVSVTIRPLPANLNQGTGGNNLTDGLVAYYPFNGNANDESGNGNHAAEIYGTVSYDNGKFDQAAKFWGINNPGHIKVNNSASLQFDDEATFATWVRMDDSVGMDGWGGYSMTGMHCLIAKDHDQHGYYEMIHFNHSSGLNTWAGCVRHVSLISDPPNGLTNNYLITTWLHLTFVYSDSSSSLYINGVLDSTSTSVADFTVCNTRDLYFGKFSDFWFPFNGALDETRIYNRALTPEEVLCLYQGNCNPLAAYLTADTVCRGSLAQLNLLNPQAGIGYALQVDSVDVTPLVFSTSDTLSLLSPALWQNASLTVRAVDTATGCEITLDSVWAVAVVAPEAVVTTGVSVCPADTATLVVTGGATYLWSTGSVNDTIVVAPAATTTYYAIAYSAMGCSDTAFTTVTVLPLPAVQAQSNSPVCEGDSLLINASGAATYTWAGPGFSSNLANAWVFPTTVSNTGWYYATGTSQQGCTQTDSVWAEVLTAFNTVQQIGICQGESYTLPGGTIVNTGGTYVDTLASTFGCDSIITTQLTIKPLPLIAIAGSSPMCQDETLMVSAAGGVSYQWTGPVSFTANTATATIPNAQPVNTGYYTVAVTGQNGCTDFDSVYVKVLPPDYREENIGICQGESYTLPNGITTFVSGTWVDTLTNIFGCDSIIATIVTVNPNPVAMAQSNAPVCEGHSLQLTLNGGAAYHWSGPNNWTSSEQSPEIAHPMPYQSGWYFATLMNEYQCDDTDSLFVMIHAQTTNVVKDSLCQGSSYQLPGGLSVTTPGIYTDTLASPTTQCDSIVLTWLTLKPQPQVSLASNSPVCIGGDAMVLVNGGIEWQWTGPNGFASDQPEAMVPMATAADSGWYYLHTTGDNGCTRTDSLLVDVHDCTGIGQWPDGLTVKVMPNPFDEKIVVELASTLPDQLKFELNSADGKMVKSNTMDLDSGVATVTITTSDLPVGFYLLKISGQQFYRVYNLLKIK